MGKNLTLSYSKPKQDFQREEHNWGLWVSNKEARWRETVAFFSGFYVPFFGGIERYTYNISKKKKKGNKTNQSENILDWFVL